MIKEILYYKSADEAEKVLDLWDDDKHNYLLYPDHDRELSDTEVDQFGIDQEDMKITKEDSAIKNIIRSFQGNDDLGDFLREHGATENEMNEIYEHLSKNDYVLLHTDGSKDIDGEEDDRKYNKDQVKERENEQQKLEEVRSQAYWLERMIRP